MDLTGASQKNKEGPPMMDSEAYLHTLNQRGALRQRITRQLAALGNAYGALKAAAGTASPGQPNLVIGPDPLEQVDPLVAEATELTARLNQNAAQVAALEKDLADAEAAAKAALKRNLRIAIVVTVIVALYFYFKH
jgi:hypothetical protein